MGDDGDAPASDDAGSLYRKLEQVVLPLYYGYSGERTAWIAVMKGAICKSVSFFNTACCGAMPPRPTSDDQRLLAGNRQVITG